MARGNTNSKENELTEVGPFRDKRVTNDEALRYSYAKKNEVVVEKFERRP